jgi:hypothetical protein
MKNTRAVLLGCFCSALAASQAEAQYIPGFGPPTSSNPWGSDITSYDLDMQYSYNPTATTTYNGTSVTGVGTLTVDDRLGTTQAGNFWSNRSGSPFAPSVNSFTGSFLLTANIAEVGGVWTVTGGNVTIDGNLLNGTGTGNLLLSGSLVTGAAGAAFGFQPTTTGDPNSAYNTFQFRFNTTGGALANYYMVAPSQGFGGIQLDAKFSSTSSNSGNGTNNAFNGNWEQDFSNGSYAIGSHDYTPGTGYADTFAPEPSVYPLAASAVALVGLALARRKVAGAVSA